MINEANDGTPDDPNENDGSADNAKAMTDQLRKDAASWSAGRSQSAGEAKIPTAAPARVAKPKAKAVKAPDPVPGQAKPFKMSYGGSTDRDYIAHRLNLGAR